MITKVCTCEIWPVIFFCISYATVLHVNNLSTKLPVQSITRVILLIMYTQKYFHQIQWIRKNSPGNLEYFYPIGNCFGFFFLVTKERHARLLIFTSNFHMQSLILLCRHSPCKWCRFHSDNHWIFCLYFDQAFYCKINVLCMYQSIWNLDNFWF